MAPRAKGSKKDAVMYDYSGLSQGIKLEAEADGKYYPAEVLVVSTSQKRAKAPVKVHFVGYEADYDIWLGGDSLRSKWLKKLSAPRKETERKESSIPKLEIKPNTVVMISTSAAYLKGHPTGLWLEELAAPYYSFKQAGHEVLIASIRGGPVPIDANSLKGDFFTKAAKDFMGDGDAFGALSHSYRISQIDFSSTNIKAIFMTGGHGVCVDFIKDRSLKKAIETTYAAGRIVAAVCHGPVCFAQCKKPDGSALVKDLEVTGFSQSEEDAVKLTELVPFVIEGKFKELGGKYSKGADWSSNVAVAGNLITGQNPQSSEDCAKAVLTAIAANA